MRIGTPSASVSSTECISSDTSPHCSVDCVANCARSSLGVTVPGALAPAAACSSSTAWICGSRTGGATALHPISRILRSDGRADGHDRDDALEQGDWERARKLFAAAGESAEALEGLGLAAWWLDEESALDARERAYRLYR